MKHMWSIQRYRPALSVNQSEIFLVVRELKKTSSEYRYLDVQNLGFHSFSSSTEFDSTNPYQHPLNLEDDGRILVLFPTIICHVIDSKSPLYTFSAKQFLENR